MALKNKLIYGFLAAGAVVFFYLGFLHPRAVLRDQYGNLIYNYYFLALLNGQLSLPVQIVGPEGHYTADGTAYTYYGIAPIITRIIPALFIDLTKTSLSAFTVYIFSVGSAFLYMKLFFSKMVIPTKGDNQSQIFLLFLVGLSVWLISPAIMLAANDSVYHEPIVIAFFLVSAFLYLLSKLKDGDLPTLRSIILISICAGFAVFARPHVAVGLYFGTVLLLAYLLFRHRRAALKLCFVSLSILFLCGLTQLGINAARFGDAFRLHGALHKDEIEMGFVFFGFQPYDTPRNLAFLEHGKFNLDRVLPNLFRYFLDAPATIPEMFYYNYKLAVEEFYAGLTSHLGFIRNEQPQIGIAFIWMPWFLLAVGGLAYLRRISFITAIMLATAVMIAFLMCAYGTLTFRYRAEIWPVVAVLAYVFLSHSKFISEQNVKQKTLTILMLLTVFIGWLLNKTLVVSLYAGYFRTHSFYSNWSDERCKIYVSVKDSLGPNAVERICTIQSEATINWYSSFPF